MPSVSPIRALLGGAVGRNLSDILNLDALLGASEDVSHLGGLMLHQILIK